MLLALHNFCILSGTGLVVEALA